MGINQSLPQGLLRMISDNAYYAATGRKRPKQAVDKIEARQPGHKAQGRPAANKGKQGRNTLKAF